MSTASEHAPDRLPRELFAALTSAWCPAEGDSLLVAVSGGADSIALLRLLAAIAPSRHWRLRVATLDHGLRGAEGAADRVFVERAAQALGLAAVGATLAADAAAERGVGGSPEIWARRERHRFLAATAADAGCRAVALAHTLDDQAETVLLRMFRGTGGAGLAAMRRLAPGPERPPGGPPPQLWRPLLGIRREVLRGWLALQPSLVAGDPPWREDASNASLVPTRNRLRTLLPELERGLPGEPVEALARMAACAAEDEELLAGLARQAVGEVVLEARPAPDPPLPAPASPPPEPALHPMDAAPAGPSARAATLVLDRHRLVELPPALSRRILMDCCQRLAGPDGRLHWTHLRALERLARADGHGTRLDLPGGLVARRAGRRLFLTAPPEADGR